MFDDQDATVQGDLIREVGLRVTRQDQTIVRILIAAENQSHADQALSRARKLDSGICRARTCRTLAVLSYRGLVAGRFEPMPVAVARRVPTLTTARCRIDSREQSLQTPYVGFVSLRGIGCPVVALFHGGRVRSRKRTRLSGKGRGMRQATFSRQSTKGH